MKCKIEYMFRHLTKMACKLPYFSEGEVVKGFGRGSKDLGIPTANFPEKVIEQLPEDMPCGVYYGWAKVGGGDVNKMVMSVGWNPYYDNKKKSMETHIIQTFKEDFYGSVLKVAMLGYIRNMKNFSSLDELVAEINQDISVAKTKLDLPESLEFKTCNFFNS